MLGSCLCNLVRLCRHNMDLVPLSQPLSYQVLAADWVSIQVYTGIININYKSIIRYTVKIFVEPCRVTISRLWLYCQSRCSLAIFIVAGIQKWISYIIGVYQNGNKRRLILYQIKKRSFVSRSYEYLSEDEGDDWMRESIFLSSSYPSQIQQNKSKIIHICIIRITPAK